MAPPLVAHAVASVVPAAGPPSAVAPHGNIIPVGELPLLVPGAGGKGTVMPGVPHACAHASEVSWARWFTLPGSGQAVPTLLAKGVTAADDASCAEISLSHSAVVSCGRAMLAGAVPLLVSGAEVPLPEGPHVCAQGSNGIWDPAPWRPFSDVTWQQLQNQLILILENMWEA